MLLTGKEPAQKLYETLPKREDMPGLLAMYDPKDVPAGWYVRTILREGNAHGIPVYACPFGTDCPVPLERLGGMILLSKPPYPIRIPAKLDVDGMGNGGYAALYAGQKEGFPKNTPCTAEACVRLLDYYSIPVSGKHVVILGRSLTVGRPLAMLLMSRDATVTVCHSKSQHLSELCQSADILICATGKSGLVGREQVSPWQTVINIGGEVIEEEVQPLVQNFCPLRGGIGALTTAVLFRHVVGN